MANHSRRKSDAARRANQIIRNRTVLLMMILGVASFLVLFAKLYDLQIRQHNELPPMHLFHVLEMAVNTRGRKDPQ